MRGRIYFTAGANFKRWSLSTTEHKLRKMENNNNAPMFLLYSHEAHRPNQSEGALYWSFVIKVKDKTWFVNQISPLA